MRSFELTLADLRARPGIKWHKYAEDVLPAWIAEMDFDVPSEIHAAMRRIVDEGAYGYEDPSLYPSIALAFGQHMANKYSWHPDIELTLPVADLVQAQFAAVNAFTDRGDGVILQMPIYPPFINSVCEQGRRVVEHRLLDDGSRFVLDTAALASFVDERTPLLMLCNPHNPTGRVFERSELEAIAEVAVTRQLIVVADEVHADLAYAGHEHVPFASLGPEVARRTITITSATKAYNIPGLRCGLMHFGSSELREKFRSRLPDRALGKVNRFGIEATVVAWRECAGWLESVMTTLRRNRELLAATLSRDLPSVRCYSPEAGYLAWLDCRALDLPGSPFESFLERARVGLNDGSEFGPSGVGHVRLNFATSESILTDVLARMARSLRM